jgi:hypothetical protein
MFNNDLIGCLRKVRKSLASFRISRFGVKPNEYNIKTAIIVKEIPRPIRPIISVFGKYRISMI